MGLENAVFIREICFMDLYGLCTKLSDSYVGINGSSTRYDLSTELCNEYTTRV